MDIRHSLHRAIEPKNIAVIGASDRPGSLGTMIWNNLSASKFTGNIYPVNPKYAYLGERVCLHKIEEIPESIDLAILALAPKHLNQALEDVAKKGARWVMLTPSTEQITADALWQAQFLARAHRLGVRVLGTNSLGLIRPLNELNASFWPYMPKTGDIGMVSQSGLIISSVLSYAQESHLGFSCLVNTASEIDISVSDVVDFLAQDEATKLIVIHVEGLRNPRNFYSAIRAAAQLKPVIVLRGGKHEFSNQLLSARMSVPAGDDRAFDALLERTGAIRVHSLDELLAAVEAFNERRWPRANRLGIICNGSGFGILAADATQEYGIALPTLSAHTSKKLQTLVHSSGAIINPVNLGPEADAQRIREAISALNRDENIDGILLVCAPSSAAPVQSVCEMLKQENPALFKPLLTAWINEQDTIQARKALLSSTVGTLRSPEMAVQAFSWLVSYSRSLRRSHLSEPRVSDMLPMDLSSSRELIEQALKNNELKLDEWQTKKVLAGIGLTTASGIVVNSPAEAVDAAKTLGFPVVLKLLAHGVLHKSNIGGVCLNLHSDNAVYQAAQTMLEDCRIRAPYAQIRGLFLQRHIHRPNAREVSVHIKTDPSFGPMISFGNGGWIGELYQDYALQLLPLNRDLANTLIQKPRIGQALGTYRGMPAINREQLQTVLLRLSTLIRYVPAIKELSIDPLLVDDGGCIVLDASIVLHHASTQPDQLASHLVICPEPKIDDAPHSLKNTSVRMRSISAQDYNALKQFLQRLSPQSAFSRFHTTVTAFAREKIIELTDIDYNREVAVVATDVYNLQQIHGVARYKLISGTTAAEFGVIIEDAWQRQGLASLLMSQLQLIAKRHGVELLVGYVLRTNEAMFGLMESLGYSRIDRQAPDDQFVTFTKQL